MPVNGVPESEVEYLVLRIEALENEVRELENNHRPTIPTYDGNDLPFDAIEGQVVILAR